MFQLNRNTASPARIAYNPAMRSLLKIALGIAALVVAFEMGRVARRDHRHRSSHPPGVTLGTRAGVRRADTERGAYRPLHAQRP